jgi:cytochrome c-type biogenesis protein CcsB
MAALSDQLLVLAIFGYALAMLGYAAEYAFGRTGAVARTALRAPRAAQLVGAAGHATPAPARAETVAADPPAARGRAELFGRGAVVVTGLAVVAHVGVLVTRGLAAHRVPWGNMYEFVLTVCLVGAVGWLALALRRPSARLLGLFVTLVLVLLLGFAGMVLYTAVAPLVPALNSYWLKIHVTAAALASGLLLLGFVPAALFLVRSGYDRGRRGFPFSLGPRLPEAAALERLTFRLHAFAFPIWTFAVICGAIWAESAWGRYWGWDPKETWAFISWVVYAGYLHARATPSVRRTTATWIAVAGWLTMLINLYVINFVAVGLHSYAGVN